MKGCVWAIAACAFIASCLVIAVGIFIALCWDENAVRPKANGFPMRIGLVDLMAEIGLN